MVVLRVYRVNAAPEQGESGHGGAARGAARLDLSERRVRSSCSAGNRGLAPWSALGAGIPNEVAGPALQPVFLGSSTSRHPARGYRNHRGIVIVHPPQVEHHRWTPQGFDHPNYGLTPLDGPTLAVLRQLRWRKSPPDRRQLWLALVVAALLHVLFIWVTWQEMRPPPAPAAVHVQRAEVMQVRFIERAVPTDVEPPPPPELPALPPRPRVVLKHVEPVSKDAMTVQLPAASSSTAPPAKLFDNNGQALLPTAASSAPAPSAAGYVQGMPKGDTQIMQNKDVVKYQTTRFNGDWGSGNVVDRALQKAVDKTTVTHTFTLPKGVHIHCGVSLAMLAGGCGGDPPAPPSAKDGDERLNMAPAQSLAPDPQAPKPPSEDACIAMYRAGKPLASGCPVDTPIRAVDAELRERAAGAVSHP
jgi:hypothetical protein